MELVFIGDIHGDFNFYHNFINNLGDKKSYQVGDYGIGFGHNPNFDYPNHKFIRGNHDNIDECKTYVNSFIPDGTIEDTPLGKMMFVGGAWSIDKQWRTPGRDWWPTEEVSLEESYLLIDKYKETKPYIMVTHDLPKTIAAMVFGSDKIKVTDNMTNTMLEDMFIYHQPRYWLHGHWHVQYHQIINNCMFVGLGINQTATLTFS